MDVKFLMGILIAYGLDCLLIKIRTNAGRRNFAAHTLISEQFLV